MGLDQEAYSRGKEDQSSFSHYWRKHNRLQGWMENLWEEKGRPNSRTENDPMAKIEMCTTLRALFVSKNKGKRC